MKAIRTKYHGPGNVRGSRISATDEDGNRIMVPVNNARRIEDSHLAAARALCAKLGWSGTLVAGSLRHGMVFVWYDERDAYAVPE